MASLKMVVVARDEMAAALAESLVTAGLPKCTLPNRTLFSVLCTLMNSVLCTLCLVPCALWAVLCILCLNALCAYQVTTVCLPFVMPPKISNDLKKACMKLLPYATLLTMRLPLTMPHPLTIQGLLEAAARRQRTARQPRGR